MEKNKQMKWLNFAKLAAIIAVITDHTNGYLYSNQDIAKASYFSVSLFIIISGMTSYLSNLKREETWIESIIRNCKKICIAYIISAVIYEIIRFNSFDFSSYLNRLVYFRASLPHYYVLLYIQLMIANRILFNLIKKFESSKYSVLFEIITFLIIVIISSYTTRYTNILNVYGGGGRVFGGTYLIIYYLGMLIMKYKIFEKTSYLKSITCFVGGSIAWFIWWRYLCETGSIVDSYFPFGNGKNPPGVSLMVLGTFTLFACYGFFTLLEKIKFASILVDLISWLGNRTLYIFLYHSLFLKYFLIPYFYLQNIWIMRIVVFSIIFVGSLLLEYVIEIAIKNFNKLMEV